MPAVNIALLHDTCSTAVMAARFRLPAFGWQSVASRPPACHKSFGFARTSEPWLRAFGTGTSQFSPPQRPPPPPPPSPPSPPSTSSPQSNKTEIPSYLRAALHKEVASYAAAQRPREIFRALFRHLKSFQPEMMDVDACLNSLVKCNTQSWSSQKFAGKDRGNVALSTADILQLLGYVQPALLLERQRHLAATSFNPAPFQASACERGLPQPSLR